MPSAPPPRRPRAGARPRRGDAPTWRRLEHAPCVHVAGKPTHPPPISTHRKMHQVKIVTGGLVGISGMGYVNGTKEGVGSARICSADCGRDVDIRIAQETESGSASDGELGTLVALDVELGLALRRLLTRPHMRDDARRCNARRVQSGLEPLSLLSALMHPWCANIPCFACPLCRRRAPSTLALRRK